MPSIPTQAQYEAREAAEFRRQMTAAEKGPLAERREAAARFAEALRDPALIAERIGWLLAGNYGHGAMVAAKRAATGRGNKAAALTQMVCAIEWMCPVKLGIAEWKRLTASEKRKLDAAVKRAIKASEVQE